MWQKHTRIAILILILIQQCVGAIEDEIDWTRCAEPSVPNEKADTVCYVKTSCLEPENQIAKMERNKYPGRFNPPNACGIGIQLKPLGTTKWIVYIQVVDPQLKVDEGVSIHSNGEKLCGCKQGNFEGSEKLALSTFHIYIYIHTKSTFEKNKIFCAFFLKAVDGDLNNFMRIHSGTNSLFLHYKTDQDKELDLTTGGSALYSTVAEIITCNPDDAEFDGSYMNDDLFTKKILLTEKENKCLAADGQLYVKTEGDYGEVDNIKCEFDSAESKYNFVCKKNNKVEKIAKGTTFYVFCGKKACTACTAVNSALNSMCTDCTNTTAYHQGNIATRECASIKCDGDRWQVETERAKSRKVVSALECKKSNRDKDKGAWFLPDEASEIIAAQCTSTYDCNNKNPLIPKCPPGKRDTQGKKDTPDDMCRGVEMEKAKIGWGCGDSPIKAQIGNEIVNVGNFSCEASTGQWIAERDSNIRIPNGSFVYCDWLEYHKTQEQQNKVVTGGSDILILTLGIVGGGVLVSIGIISFICIRRHRRYTASERELRKRPGVHWLVQLFSNSGLPTGDLAAIKEWDDVMFEKILDKWTRFSIYERYKFAERLVFELGVASTCEQFISLFVRVFEVEPDYRVWQAMVPAFKLLHAQAADKEENKNCDKRLRKLAIKYSKALLQKVGWEGVDSELRDTAYQRYVVFNLLYYCDDKDSIEKMIDMYDKYKYNLHSICRQICWAAAVREKGQFELTAQAERTAVINKNITREKDEKENLSRESVKGKKSAINPKADGSTKSKDDRGKDKKKRGGSKEAGKGGSKESKSSNNSNNSGKDKKKGSKEQPSSQGGKDGSKESKSNSRESDSGKDKKKGGSKEVGKKKGKSREKAGADDNTASESAKDKKEPSGKDMRSGKDKKEKSGKEKISDKDKRSGKSKGSSKEKKSDKSSKEKSGKGSKEKISSKEKKSSKSGKDKKDKSEKGTKTTEKTAADVSGKTAGTSARSKKSTKKWQVGPKERRDADGDKLHGDRAQHLFFAVGSNRNKEQIAAFLIEYIEKDIHYDPSNLVYLFQAALEWDDTRAHAIDLFLGMPKEAFKKIYPGHKYHMRILKNFRRYVVGQIDLQKIQDHVTTDPNYTNEIYKQLEMTQMLKRIHNNVLLQPLLIDELDAALKKFDF